MALSCSSMILDVQALVGRPSSTDPALITDARVWRWLNEGQQAIVRYCHNIPNLQFKCTTSIGITTDDMYYSVGDITFLSADNTYTSTAYINTVYVLDGANSIWLDFQPTDEFDKEMIDPTSSEESSGVPRRWTRRGNTIEIAPRPSSDYNGNYLRVDGVRWPCEFTSDDSTRFCEISGADRGLIYYAVGEAFAAMGMEADAAIWRKRFTNPSPIFGEDYGWLEKVADSYTRLDAYDHNIVFD